MVAIVSASACFVLKRKSLIFNFVFIIEFCVLFKRNKIAEVIIIIGIFMREEL